MSVADFTLKANDTSPSLTDSLQYSNGSAVDLTGATLQFVMRSFSALTPVTLTGTTSITSAQNGNVAYTFSATDSGTSGMYMGSWVVTFPNTQRMTFPTVGYLIISIEESLTEAGVQRLVSLPELKDYLNVDHADRRHDQKLLRFIDGIRPQIERIVGPILPTVFEEWFEGGNSVISLTNRPSAGTGCSPRINVIGVEEFRGPISYPLSLIPGPPLGSIYSCQLDQRLGTLTRRSAGGSTIPFPLGASAVHCVYQSFQASIPLNVIQACLEWARSDQTLTQAVGAGRQTLADQQDIGQMIPQGMPRHVLELLSPARRGPAIA